MERLIFPVTKKEAEKSERKYSSEKNKNALFAPMLKTNSRSCGVAVETFVPFIRTYIGKVNLQIKYSKNKRQSQAFECAF